MGSSLKPAPAPRANHVSETRLTSGERGGRLETLTAVATRVAISSAEIVRRRLAASDGRHGEIAGHGLEVTSPREAIGEAISALEITTRQAAIGEAISAVEITSRRVTRSAGGRGGIEHD